MGCQATTEVKVISPEIPKILEADVFRVTEGSIYSTISPNLQSVLKISRSLRTRQGAVSPTGSQTVAWHQKEIMGTREAQYVLSKGVCTVKPINGKMVQTAYWESDQFIVLMKQGNACGGKGLTKVRLTSGAHLPH